jgi:hypothetical protein
MHRSGTSMVTRLLNVCGVYLGPDDELMPALPENAEGFWEHLGMVAVNDELLAHFGGRWDRPPTVGRNWEHGPALAPVYDRAQALLARFRAAPLWGWKDPRNCLTIPFWSRLLPDLRVLVCLRNPIEVVHSLQKRNGFSEAHGFDLWLTYHQRLLAATRPGTRVVTHYDGYFGDARTELCRVLDLLGMEVSPETVEQACPNLKSSLRHNHTTTKDLQLASWPAPVLQCYAALCAEAGQGVRQGDASRHPLLLRSLREAQQAA